MGYMRFYIVGLARSKGLILVSWVVELRIDFDMGFGNEPWGLEL